MKTIVIGGGAAGMMAAIKASEKGERVVIFEKNEKLGKKLFITGKGRCNITNNCDADDFFKNVNRNSKFLYSAYNAFDSQAVMEFFEKEGLFLKTERGNRVFPNSDHSSDVIKSLEKALKINNVEVRLNTEVRDILADESKNTVTGVLLSDGSKVSCDRVIVATGGVSYPLTGSTGDGYRFAEKFDITVNKTYPSLVPLCCSDEWIKEVQGLSLKNVSFCLMNAKKKVFDEQGEMLFTHFGLSGPLILSASSLYVENSIKGKCLSGFIDLKPALSEENLDKRILRDFSENNNKAFKNSLDGLLPKSLIPVIISKSGINEFTRVNEITREQRKNLVNLLKHLEVNITGTRPVNEAIITKGGVSVKEINPKTMESKRVNNLFFAGEVLDLDAMTGGFNLQIAWCTGACAGTNGKGENYYESDCD